MDHFSPTAPAHIRVLVLPLGRLRRDDFTDILHHLQVEANVISLEDIEKENVVSDECLLTPKGSAASSLLLNYSSAAPSEQQQNLAPFELFREPLIVLGIRNRSEDATNVARDDELSAALAHLRERHPRVVLRQVLTICNAIAASQESTGEIVTTSADENALPHLYKAAVRLCARFLVEFATYTTAIQALPSVQTPGQTSRSLQRTAVLREEGRLSDSGRFTPPPTSTGMSSPSENGSPAPQVSANRPAPATTFEQIINANASLSGALSRSDSNASNHSAGNVKKSGHGRTGSQDKIATSGFGSNISPEKARARGKARVAVVVASIFMLAGQWRKSLAMFSDQATKLRTLGDNVWYGKSMENMIVCMLLMAWAGIDFQIPPACFVIEKGVAGQITRLSGTFTQDGKLASTSHESLAQLTSMLPELSKLILQSYHSGEGALELPHLANAEASLRCAKLLTMILVDRGEITSPTLHLIAVGPSDGQLDLSVAKRWQGIVREVNADSLRKSTIASLLCNCLPGHSDSLATADHIRILGGVSSSYALLGMERKRALTLRDMVLRLTTALIDARKLGAAEMGIHPAASLSHETSAAALLEIARESRDLEKLVLDIAKTYGIQSAAPDTVEDSSRSFVGGRHMKLQVLREMSALSEASPDPHGILRLASLLLHDSHESIAVDKDGGDISNPLDRDEQMYYATLINRTVIVSKHLGLTEAEAMYWDQHLVRGVAFRPPETSKSLLDRKRLTPSQMVTADNMVLYNANPSRPGTANTPLRTTLVAGETVWCDVTLQNPFDISIDIASIDFVVEGVPLVCQFAPTSLRPLRFQRFAVAVLPSAPGDFRITACRIKVQGCQEQVFPIVDNAWSPRPPLTVKSLGLDSLMPVADEGSKRGSQQPKIKHDQVAGNVVDAMPMLEIDSAEDLALGTMLLEGEQRRVDIKLKNTSTTVAQIWEISDTESVSSFETALRASPGNETDDILWTIDPGQSQSVKLRVLGKAGISRTEARFYYSASLESPHARLACVPIDITVNSALQVHYIDVIQAGTYADQNFLLMDIGNAFPKTISYTCDISLPSTSSSKEQSGDLSPGEIRRIRLPLSAKVLSTATSIDANSIRTQFLSLVNLEWTMTDRKGRIDLSQHPLSPEAIEILTPKSISLALTVLQPALTNPEPPQSSAFTPRVESQVDDFLTIRARIIRRGDSALTSPLLARLLPCLRDTSHVDRHLAISGPQQRILTARDGIQDKDGTVDVDFVLAPLLAGKLELRVEVRPARIGGVGAETWREREKEWVVARTIVLDVVDAQ